MQDKNKTKEELIAELASLRRKIAEQERSKPPLTPAEQLIRTSEAKYQRLFDIATIGIFQSSLEGKVITANAEFAHLFGYESPEDVIASVNDVGADMYVDPRRRGEIVRLMSENPSLRSFENIYRRKDGSTFMGNLHIWPVRDGDGRLLTIEGFVEDVTERKQAEEALQRAHNELEQRVAERTEELLLVNELLRKEVTGHQRAEEALRESEADYRRLFESSPSVIYQVDFRTGKFVKANDTACEYLGYSQEEITSVSPYDILTEESKLLFLERLSKMSSGEEVTENPEYEVMDKNGRRWWLQLSSKNIYDREGLAGADVVAHDITARKLAEEALRKSEERFRLAFATSPDAININRLSDGLYVDINDGFTRLTGFTREDAIGRTSLEIDIWCNPADRRKLLDELKENGYCENLEAEFRRKDGTTTTALMSARIIVLQDIPHILSITRDISDRKRVAEVLQESETKLQLIFDKVGTGILIIDKETQIIIDANQTAVEMVAMPKEMMIGQPCYSIVCPAQAGNCPVKDLGQTVDHSERKLLCANGRLKDILKTVYPITIKGRDCYLENFIDITNQKRTEASLRDYQRTLTDIIDFLPDATFVIDNNGIVTAWNHSMELLTGIKAEDMIGKGDYEYALPFYGERRPIIIDLILSADDEFLRKSYDAVKCQDTVLSGEVYVPQTFGGKGAYLWGNASRLYNSNGEVIGAIQSTRDITAHRQAEAERRELEERLQRAEKMESLGLLAGGVAHDLNNVLGIVVGYAEMLMDEMDESNPMKDDLKKILEGGNRSAAIVQDLLTLARRGVQTKKAVNLNTIITDCQKTPEFEKVFSYNPYVKLKVDIESDLLNIMGSPVHLVKTIINLASNAVEAMPNGGIIKITTTNQYLDVPIQGYDNIREGDYVVLTVSDTGEGILERDIRRIFEPFYTKKIMGRSGTGLGLAVVWGTIKDHNGYINVKSAAGKGTIFTLYFPVTREDIDTDQISVSISEYMGKGETILVVDDINHQRELASRMLSKLNYKVTTTASGEEAVEYLRTNKADLIVLDMIMDPGIDGLETYHKILEISPAQKAIIVSGFSESDRVKEAQTLGAGAYLKKPYLIEKIGLAVRKELDRK
jgi:PAS domain S-box-containing protein